MASIRLQARLESSDDQRHGMCGLCGLRTGLYSFFEIKPDAELFVPLLLCEGCYAELVRLHAGKTTPLEEDLDEDPGSMRARKRAYYVKNRERILAKAKARKQRRKEESSAETT